MREAKARKGLQRHRWMDATTGIYHSVWVTVWYAGWDKKINSVYRAYFTADGGQRKNVL